MEADKQILEMARVLMEKCDEELDCSKKADCDMCRAERLYEKGYRRASDVAREIFEEIEKYVEVALMNGHIETPILCIGHGTFAKLKKKYTEAEKR